MSEAGEPSRWTCEACGCHTNLQTDRNCGICGTSRSGSVLLRRRAPWLSHPRAIVGIPPDEDDDDVQDFIHQLHHPPPHADLWDMDDADSAIESLAMEVASSRGRMIDSRERFLEAAREFSQRRRPEGIAGSGRTRSETAAAATASQQAPPPRLTAPQMRAAASTDYQPGPWRRPTVLPTRGGGTASSVLMEVGQGERENMAHVPFGAGEGRAIRAEGVIPRLNAALSIASTTTGPSTASNEPPKRNIFGFRVAFDRPNCEQGASLGGGYMVGVTTSSFAAYGDHNALQNTPFFWGIEDSGKKFEGTRRGQWTLAERAYPPRRSGASSNPLQPSSSSPYATQLGSQDASMNAHGVLFGNREVVTVVCDLDHRLMVFWRDSTLLGIQVTPLPRADMYPVAVPFHQGSVVAITSLEVDPLPLLAAFAADLRQAQRDKDEELHRKLLVDRGVLVSTNNIGAFYARFFLDEALKHASLRRAKIQRGEMTETLRSTLIEIFTRYSKHDEDPDRAVLEYTEAARLFYRCGLKLSLLDDHESLTIAGFLAIFERICADDEAKVVTILPHRVEIKVGDYVELVEGYTKFGDAAGGPLLPSERGIVVDLQNGADGQRKSVRVLHNQRRWWYQPSAIMSESSGLVETPAVFLIRLLLRAHGYDHTTLTQLSTRTLRANMCQVGDIVKPRKATAGVCFGHVTDDSIPDSDHLAPRSRAEHSSVPIEFADRQFAEATGVNAPILSTSSPQLQTRRVRHAKLAFCSADEIVAGCPDLETSTEDDLETAQESDTLCHRLQSEIAALSRLDRSAIEVITRECKKSSTLASVFSAGLPEAMISAVDAAERQMLSLEPREDLPENVALLGNLALVISRRLFLDATNGTGIDEDDKDETDHEDSRPTQLSRRTGMRTIVAARQNALDEQLRAVNADVGNLGNALQQRRNILLSLMNRARSTNQGFLFGDIDRDGLFGELSLHDVMPPLAFGSASGDPAVAAAVDFFGEIGSETNSPVNRSASDEFFGQDTAQSDATPTSSSYLDSVVRYRTERRAELSPNGGGAPTAFVNQLVSKGILFNDVPWIKACAETQTKKAQHTAMHRKGSVFRDAVDEEGNSLLLLAIVLGCSAEVLAYLIGKGARVTHAEVQKAASTNQSASLRLLLQHTSFPGDASGFGYSSEILAVLQEATERFEELQKKMREKAGSFIIALTQRLIRFGLALHRRPSPRAELCSRSLANVLVGDVLLLSLRKAQQLVDAGASPRSEGDRILLDVSSDAVHEQEIKAGGLIGSFPQDILGEAIFSDSQHVTSFLALIEDYLCRKDLSDASAGMILLHTMLRTFPDIRGSSELQRFGIPDKVTFHLQSVSKRLDDALKHCSGGSKPAYVIQCPKKHSAVIHITRHNSFRCDICGCGVDRGRPMYGCRECDWDACETCTDKSESGTVKCVTVKNLASDCLRLLSDSDVIEAKDFAYTAVVEELEASDNTESLKVLLDRLLNRDLHAIDLLGELLNGIGKVTIHQFQFQVLPVLLSCLAGQVQDEQRAEPARRKKRARVVDDQQLSFLLDCSSDERIRFAKQVARVLFSDRPRKHGDADELAGAADSDYEFTCSDEAQEVLRRCHQLLSLHENVEHMDNMLNMIGANQNELSSLTKAIVVKLAPSALQAADCGRFIPIQVSAQPLVLMSDIQAVVLRSCRILDASYIAFASQLVDDHAIIVVKSDDARQDYWGVAAVISFDENEGTHLLVYANGLKRRHADSLIVSMSTPLERDNLIFENESACVDRVNLAARSYFILSRPGQKWKTVLHTNESTSDKPMLPSTSSDAQSETSVQSLTRAWSALSLADAMRPVDLKIPSDVGSAVDDDDLVLRIKIGESSMRLVCEKVALESPPSMSVSFSLNQKTLGLCFKGNPETTLVNALSQLYEHEDKISALGSGKMCQLYYSVTADYRPPGAAEARKMPAAAETGESRLRSRQNGPTNVESRARKLSSLTASAKSPSLDDNEDAFIDLCDGIDGTALQCMKVINLLRIYTQSTSDLTSNGAYESLFVNTTLSKKLKDQLDMTVPVVSKSLPSWCVAAPSFAPSVFSYESRKSLLERVAFGISRSTLKQQEAKVNVTRFRQRMAALRNRAVELVGEAFSGGAEDPTALQLQADELYGMEEALASKVRTAFKAAKWQEHTLQVAKASIRREHLLADANAVMQLYTSDKNIFHRRLEIRFEGESGFDLASGSEAGVTRGFYADVAESLLSTENVAGVYSADVCADTSLVSKMISRFVAAEPEQPQQQRKLPLWIPDLDSSGAVVIPTPRADENGHVGVFPRPLPAYHPLLPDVLQRFRFVGRLFAAATRDGFVFPLPLSPSFLKLVICGKAPHQTPGQLGAEHIVLTSQDLPRPGFLGGEVYAAERYICRALDAVDTADPPLSRFDQDKRYKEIASDVGFARVALGKAFDCSFEDYFQDRNFVDPLDPAQDESAMPLCPGGHEKRVTIYNVREWVGLAKKFMLCDGIMLQANAFRDGIEDFFSVDYLRVFTPEELHRDICGGGDGVDKWNESAVRKLFKLDGGKEAAEALVAVAAIGGEGGNSMSRRFGPTSPTIGFLIKALLEGTPQQRRQFLSFVTSVPIETPGRIEVVPLVSPSGEFLPMNDPGCLPRANTCARRLYLPKFASYDGGSESFKEVFWAVVREESRFKGFYEWRG